MGGSQDLVAELLKANRLETSSIRFKDCLLEEEALSVETQLRLCVAEGTTILWVYHAGRSSLRSTLVSNAAGQLLRDLWRQCVSRSLSDIVGLSKPSPIDPTSFAEVSLPALSDDRNLSRSTRICSLKSANGRSSRWKKLERFGQRRAQKHRQGPGARRPGWVPDQRPRGRAGSFIFAFDGVSEFL